MPYILALLNTSSPAPTGEGTTGLQGSSVFSVVMMLLVMVAVIVAAYFVTRFVAGGAMRMQKGSRMRVVDRLSLARDKAVMVVEIAGRYYALGVSGNAVNLLCELDERDFEEAGTVAPQGEGWRSVWNRAVSSTPAPTPRRNVDDGELDRMAARIRRRSEQIGGKEGHPDEEEPQ